MPLGGKREGAGRKKGSVALAAEFFRQKLAEDIRKEATEWLNAIKDPARGIFREVKQPDGTYRVYKEAPDPEAWEKAMNRAFGKPAESMDLTTNGKDLPVPILGGLLQPKHGISKNDSGK